MSASEQPTQVIVDYFFITCQYAFDGYSAGGKRGFMNATAQLSRRTGEHRFELTGGALALDFANTLDDRHRDLHRDHLPDFGALVSWSRQAGAMNNGQAAFLVRAASRRAAAARAALRRGHVLREAIYRIFSAEAHGRAVPPADLALLNAEVANFYRRLRIKPMAPAKQTGRIARTGRAFAWDWDEECAALERMLWPVVRSAAELLTSEDIARVRECAADTCGWLFLDRSKNRTRRWCDMKVCGNRAKAREFYKRSL